MLKQKNYVHSKSATMLLASLLLSAGFIWSQEVVSAQENATASTDTSLVASGPSAPQAEISASDKTQTSSASPNQDTDKETITDSDSPTPAASSMPAVKAEPTAQPAQAAVNENQPKPAKLSSTAYVDGEKKEKALNFSLEEYQKASASQLANLVRHYGLSGDQLLDYAIQTIKASNPNLNNVISLREDLARKESAAMVDTGQPFYKVPILVKGLGHTVSGGSNTNGLAFLDGKTSTSTGSYVKELQKAGFVVIGQSSYPEMGWINVTNSDLYGITHNPWNLDHNPGGSSGGSAAAVSYGQVPVASASDGGGSTRIPASWTGLIGLHPSRGILEGNSSSETSNVSHFALTKSMEDTSTLFEFLLKDKTKNLQTKAKLSQDMTIAYTKKTPAGTPISPEAVAAVDNALVFLKEQGFKTVEVDYPVDGKAMMEDYYKIAASGAGVIDFLAQQNLKRHLQKEDVELLSWALYQTSKDLSKEDVKKAWEHIASMNQVMAEFYKKYPLFLTPTTAFAAPSADYHHIAKELIPQLEDMSKLSKTEKLDLIYKQWLPAWTLTPFTQLANLSGTPSLSLPTHVTKDGLPLGILFNSSANNDRLLLQMGDLFEKAGLFQTLYHHQVPTTTQEGTDPILKSNNHKNPTATFPIQVHYHQTNFLASPKTPNHGQKTLPDTKDSQYGLMTVLGYSFIASSLLILAKRKKT
ncbi:amidase family protein [Streptococcus didelphis]|uniref:amidase family protein n=1 Tax=Streptococcus didelphis TaxID=102886 RepID=UPI000374D026|nr:amidase family protein [Streptococcus didelphis]